GGPAAEKPGGDAAHPGPGYGQHPAGPDGFPQPALHHLRSGRRARLLPPQSATPDPAAAGRQAVTHGAHPFAGSAYARVPAPDEWGDAPAYRRGDRPRWRPPT